MRYSLAVLAVSVMTGCSTPAVEPTFQSPVTHVQPVFDGLSVKKLELMPTNKNFKESLELFGDPIGDPILVDNLQFEGIYVRKVQTVDLPAIITSIGNVTDEETVWHGQIIDWRDIQLREILSRGMLITSGGISYFVQRGFLSLLARSWLVQREDGLFVYLQMMPTWHVPRGQKSIVNQSTKPIENRIFLNLTIETLLVDGEALIFAVELVAPESSTGPQDEGPPAVRLGEALMGGPVTADRVSMLVIEANIRTRQ